MSKRNIYILLICLICIVLLLVWPKRVSNPTTDAGLVAVKLLEKVEILPDAKILFVGDMMFDRTIRNIGNEKGYEHIFSCLNTYLNDFDIVFGNLEGPITEYPSRSANTVPGEPGNTSFTFDPIVADLLARHNIRFVSLGNNHISDFGKEGRESTKTHLSNENISYVGVPGETQFVVTNIDGVCVGFVAFNQFLGEGDEYKTVQAIREASTESDYVIVYTHWGEEYVEATEYMKYLARTFVDAGADMVIGSHPHVIQESELYKGKYIYYSLGNFIFDQYWMDEVKTGLGVEVTIGVDIEVKEVLFDIGRDGRTCLKE